MDEQLQPFAQAPEKDMSLREMILKAREWAKYLLSKWWLLLLFGLLGAAIGYWRVKNVQPVYSATTTFVLETGGQGGGLGQYAGIASMMGVDVGSGGGLFQGENILELYKSRTMISRTLLTPVNFEGRNSLLLDRYIDFKGLRKKWAKDPALRNISFSESNKYSNHQQQVLHDSIISGIVKNITKNDLFVGKPDKKLNIISVTVTAEDEPFAKAFNETLVQNVNEFYLQTKTKKSLDNVYVLQRKTDSVKAAMTGSIYRAAQVADATPNLNPTRQAQRAAPIQSAQANAKINEGILGELITNLELSKIALGKDTPLIQVVDAPVLPLDKSGSEKIKFLLMGGIAGLLLAMVILIVVRLYRKIMNEA